MISKEEKEIILDFVFKDQDTLRMVLVAGAVYDEIRKKIIVSFSELLENEIKKFLDNKWLIDNILKERPLERYACFGVRKKEWGERYGIYIEAQGTGAKEFIIGILKKPEAPQINELKELLDNKCGQGNSHEWWVWYRKVDEHYKSWDDEHVLVEMYFKNEEHINYFKEEILKIKELASDLIDKAVRSL
ncbi:MAG TPA: hypothetical protein GXX25_07210 [Desulfotomaculum sp.]|nr:hypothetical protein [Desulfotomaculum sp.]